MTCRFICQEGRTSHTLSKHACTPLTPRRTSIQRASTSSTNISRTTPSWESRTSKWKSRSKIWQRTRARLKDFCRYNRSLWRRSSTFLSISRCLITSGCVTWSIRTSCWSWGLHRHRSAKDLMPWGQATPPQSRRSRLSTTSKPASSAKWKINSCKPSTLKSNMRR